MLTKHLGRWGVKYDIYLQDILILKFWYQEGPWRPSAQILTCSRGHLSNMPDRCWNRGSPFPPMDNSSSEKSVSTGNRNLPGSRSISDVQTQWPVLHRMSSKGSHDSFPTAPTPAGGLSHSSLRTISGLLPVLSATLGRAGRPRNVVTGADDVPEVSCSISPVQRGSCGP